jgi:hypothetical protein
MLPGFLFEHLLILLGASGQVYVDGLMSNQDSRESDKGDHKARVSGDRPSDSALRDC